MPRQYGVHVLRVVLPVASCVVLGVGAAACGDNSAPRTSQTSVVSAPSATSSPATTSTAAAPDRLKALIPPGLQCDLSAGGFADQPASIARAVCNQGAPSLVVYWLFPDAATLAAGFNKPLRADLNQRFVACPGKGQSPQSWRSATDPARGGQLSCIIADGGGGSKGGEYPTVTWTVDSQLLLGSVGGDKKHNLNELYQWWSAHGQ